MTDDSTRQPKTRPPDYEKQRDNASMGGPSADLDREDIEAIIQEEHTGKAPGRERARPGAGAPPDDEARPSDERRGAEEGDER
jgi:hypothetical protein